MRCGDLRHDDADCDARPPFAQEREVGISGPTVREKRNDRCWQDRGERCRDGNMHRLVRCHTAVHQPIVDDRNDDDPATDADQPGQEAGAHPSDAAQCDERPHGEFLSRLMFLLRG